MSYTTGTTFYNSNVLNIIDLQTNATNAAGISLTDAVNQLSQMVNYENKQINADILSAFTPGGNINVISPLNVQTANATTLSNTEGGDYSLYVYGTVFASNYNSLCPLRFTVGHEAPKEAMHIAENGFIGIGTDKPEAVLDVTGPVIFRGPVVFRGPVTFDGDVTIKGKLLNIGTT